MYNHNIMDKYTSTKNLRFKKLCQAISFDLSNNESLINSELEIQSNDYQRNQDTIYCTIDFKDIIKPDEFFALRRTILNSRNVHLNCTFVFNILQYSPEYIASFINQLINQNSKYQVLKKIDFSNLVLDDDFNINVDIKNDEIYNEIAVLSPQLNAELQDFGFKKLQINFHYRKVEEHTREIASIINEDNKIEKNNHALFLQRLKEAKVNNDDPENSKKSVSENWSRIKYEEYKINEIPGLLDKSKVVVSGEIFNIDLRITKNNTYIYLISITDNTEAIEARFFKKEALTNAEKEVLTEGNIVKIFGSIVEPNQFNNNTYGINMNAFELVSKANKLEDIAPEKRIELHVSSKMNTMDGLIAPEDIPVIASQYKMNAVAIMDVDGVQGFPKFASAAKKANIKPLFGAAFSTAHKENMAFYGPVPKGNIKDYEYISFDIETSRLSGRFGKIIEYGSMRVYDQARKIDQPTQFFVKMDEKVSSFTTQLTGITNEDLKKYGIDIVDALKRIYDNLNNKIALAHNASFDFHFLKELFRRQNMPFPNVTVIDTLVISRIVYPDEKKHRLENLAKRVGVEYNTGEAHRGDYDANVLAQVWVNIVALLEEMGINTFEELSNTKPETLYYHLRPYEISTLVKNETGLKEQFVMITDCLTKNFYGKPITFWEDLNKYQNLLKGSGTLKSKVIDALFYSSEDELKKYIAYFDYIEVPAPSCFEHWVADGDFSWEEVREALATLIKIAKEQNKIVVATCDVKYESLKDKKAYEVLIYSKGINNSRHYLYNYGRAKEKQLINIPTQYFKNTNELLQEFAFLKNDELAYEIVVSNTNLVANLCDNIKIIKDDLYTPIFDDSANKLRELVYQTAYQRYGDPLPKIIAKRIEDELTPITKYGFHVIYWISHKLVKKSVDEGYRVGSRGSVGSSIVANLCGVSEVNPLEAHYLCNKCKYFEIPRIDNINCGFDLPNKQCPRCGEALWKDGHTIAFETFLGFNADKVPDIDLNFSGKIQATVHQEAKRLFGETHTFKAGTVLTIKEKTAYGYVKNYLEETDQNFSNAFIKYLAHKMDEIKKTNGTHPGGVIVIPKHMDILDFTPYNTAGSDADNDWFTTHFSYKAIHDNVLKLDLLGHENPTVIKLLEKYTNIQVQEIPTNESRVFGIFTSPEELGITPEQISGESTGALGIPEFGTTFVRGMLAEAKPKSFGNLISLSGLSHGTNVWLNNARDLIMKDGLTIDDVISCRDDIMIFLQRYNVPNKAAFDIMENVRKGKKLKPDDVELLNKHNVPQWLIDSMQKIEYLFPRAHATAYVIMAYWIAWFKIFKPLAFYSSYLATHAKAIDIKSMIDEKNGLLVTNKLKELRSTSSDKLSQKEKDLIPTLEVIEEMYARGFNISDIDLMRSEASEWIIDEEHGCLIPPFSSLDGLGDAVAESIIKARNEKMFISRDDFIRRTTVNKTQLQDLIDLGVLKVIPENDQISLF